MRTKVMGDLKHELKLTAHLIREKRKIFRYAVSQAAKKNENTSTWHNKNLRLLKEQLGVLVFDYRHKHIAFCLLRGKTREQIEKPTKWNPASESQVDDLLNHYAELIEKELQEKNRETLHTGS